MSKPVTYMETSDVARALGVSSRSVSNYADADLLPVAAITLRGCRLFRRADRRGDAEEAEE